MVSTLPFRLGLLNFIWICYMATCQRLKPGIAVQVNRKGLDYVQNFAMQIIDKEMRQILIPSWRVVGTEMVMKNIRIVRYIRPKVFALDAEPPNRITWRARDISISPTGVLESGPLEANVTIFVQSLSLRIGTELSRSATGTLQTEDFTCSARIGNDVDFDFKSEDAETMLLLQQSEPLIEAQFRKIFSEKICDITQYMVDSHLRHIFDQYTSSVNLVETLDFLNSTKNTLNPRSKFFLNFRSRPLGFLFPLDELKNFAVDTSITEDPTVTRAFLRSKHSGRIFWASEKEALASLPPPFDPPPLPNFPPHSQMVGMMISDYPLNTFSQTAFHKRLLMAKTSRKYASTSMAGFLAPSCPETSRCVGQIFPKLKEQGQSHEIVMRLQALEPPTFKFLPNYMQINASGLLAFRVPTRPRNGNRNIMFASVNVVGRASGQIRNQRITGRFMIDDLELRVRESSTNETVQRDKLKPFIQELVEAVVNEDLRQGFPIPILQAIRLQSTRMNILQDAVFITTDFRLGEQFVIDKMRATLKEYFDSQQ